MADEIVAVYRAEVEQYKKAVDELVGKVDKLDKEQERVKTSGKDAFNAVAGEAAKVSPVIGQATDAMSSLRASVMTVITAMKTLRGAVIATGIGALVIAIGAVTAAVTRLDGPLGNLNVLMKQVGAAVDVVLDRVAKFGSGLIDLAQGQFAEGLNKIQASFKGIGDEMTREVRIAKILGDQMEALDDSKVVVSATVTKLRAEIDKLNASYGDASVSLQQQLADQKRILELRKQISDVNVGEIKALIANELGQTSVNESVESFIARVTDANNVLKTTAERAKLAEQLIKEIGISESTGEDFERVVTLINELTNAEAERFQGVRRTNAAINGLNAAVLEGYTAQEEAAKKAAEAEEVRLEKVEADRMVAMDSAFKTAELAAQKALELDAFVTSRRVQSIEQDKNAAIAAEQVKADMAVATAINIGASEEKITAIKEASINEQLRIEADYREQVAQMEADNLQAVLDAEEAKKAARKATNQQSLQDVVQYAQGVQSLINGIANAAQQAHQWELQSLQTSLDQGQISREHYDARRREMMEDNARQQKDLAILNAIINTAVAVTTALATGPPQGYILAALSAALGAVEIATIEAQPIPQFATGVIGLNGAGTETSDSIPAMLSRGESVMTAAETRKYRPILEGIRRGTLDEIIRENYVRPAIDAALLNGFADMGTPAMLNDRFNDMNLLRAIDRHRESDKDGFRYLAAELSKKMKAPKRGGYA